MNLEAAQQLPAVGRIAGTQRAVAALVVPGGAAEVGADFVVLRGAIADGELAALCKAVPIPVLGRGEIGLSGGLGVGVG
jgi:hypothetical protein